MTEQEARALADEIRRCRVFHVERVADWGGGWSVQFSITTTCSRHWVNSREDFAWVKRNLADPRNVAAVQEAYA